MTQEIKDKIFEPYFTTKKQGKGTGLGLAVVYGIVKESNGDIEVISTMGQGTTFKVYLPLITRSAGEVLPEGVDTDILTGTEHILLVDDEKQILELVKKMLERLGYTVTACLGSMEALEVFKNQPETFDLVISDMSMPNMTGDALAKKLSKSNQTFPSLSVPVSVKKSRRRRRCPWVLKDF